MKDLHVRIGNGEANFFEKIKHEIVDYIREFNEWPGADNFPYNGIKNTDLIEAMIELCYNCIANHDSTTFYNSKDMFVRLAIIRAVMNRM